MRPLPHGFQLDATSSALSVFIFLASLVVAAAAGGVLCELIPWK